MRNLLLIAYEFPPSAGGGVQRLTKFARYLPDSGWKPTVLCAEPAWGRPVDDSLLEQLGDIEVVRLPARNVSATIARVTSPLRKVRSALRTSSAGAPSGTQAASTQTSPSTPRMPWSTRIMRRYWIDAAEPWSRHLLPAARELHATHGFDAVLASGPPPSALIAAAEVARELELPLLADFRDAWATRPDFRRPERPALDRRLLAGEREVLRVASAGLAVSEPIAEEMREFGAREVLVIPNGFDPSDLPVHAPSAGPLRIAFMGRFYGTTDPTPFLDGLAMVRERAGCEAIEVVVVGPPSDDVRNAIAARGLETCVRLLGFRPHSEALEVVASADVGLVVLSNEPGAEAIYTGKLFEYLGMRIPVLLVGPDQGVAAKLIREANAGRAVPYGDAAAVADTLAALVAEKAAGRPLAQTDSSAIARFDRREQAALVAGVLGRIVEGGARG